MLDIPYTLHRKAANIISDFIPNKGFNFSDISMDALRTQNDIQTLKHGKNAVLFPHFTYFLY